MSDDVIIGGVGVTTFGKQPGRRPRDLVAEAVRQALDDACLAPSDIQMAYCSSLYQGPGVGQRLLKDAGFAGTPIINVENACASSSTSVYLAATFISSGAVDAALCVGVESFSHPGVATLPSDDPLAAVGATWPVMYALQARSALAAGRFSERQLARIAVKNRTHASANPKAHYQDLITEDEVLASRMVCDPLTLLQCCPHSDGAAAVVLLSERKAQQTSASRAMVRLKGSAMRSGVLTDKARPEIPVSAIVAGLAYAQASIDPADIDVCELHDAFTIGEADHYETLKLCEDGGAADFIERGGGWHGSNGVVVNPGGGLMSRGHPLGATGAAQLAEVVTQLRGEAGDRQVPGARVGVTHTMGGTVFEMESNVSVVHVLTT